MSCSPAKAITARIAHLPAAVLVALSLLAAGCGDKEPPPALGLLREVSALPFPADAPYPDCLQVVHLARIEAWPNDLPAPSEEGVLLAWPGFLDRKPTPMAGLIAGDAIRLRPVPWEAADARWRSMQRADSVTSFDLPLYFAEEVEHVRDFRESGGELNADTPLPAPPPPALGTLLAESPVRRDDEARQARIAAQIAAIERLADEHGGWEAWNASLHPFYLDLLEKASAQGGLREGNHFFERSYNHRFTELLALEEPPALKMLVALDRELAKQGVDLLVVPFPMKEEINADRFSDLSPSTGASEACLSPERLRCLRWLLERDVEVVDLAPAFRQRRDDLPWLYYDFEDHHPARDGLEVAAEVIAGALDRFEFEPRYQGLQQRDIEFDMPERYLERFDFAPDPARYPARQILQEDDGFLPVEPRKSPILLIGDSFTRVPWLYGVRNAGLQEQLTWQTGVVPRMLSIYGSASQVMRNLRREGPGFLDEIEVCVFVFAQYPMFVEVDEQGRLQESADGEAWEIVPLP